MGGVTPHLRWWLGGGVAALLVLGCKPARPGAKKLSIGSEEAAIEQLDLEEALQKDIEQRKDREETLNTFDQVKQTPGQGGSGPSSIALELTTSDPSGQQAPGSDPAGEAVLDAPQDVTPETVLKKAASSGLKTHSKLMSPSFYAYEIVAARPNSETNTLEPISEEDPAFRRLRGIAPANNLHFNPGPGDYIATIRACSETPDAQSLINLGLGQGSNRAQAVFRDMMNQCKTLYGLDRPNAQPLANPSEALLDACYEEMVSFYISVATCGDRRQTGLFFPQDRNGPWSDADSNQTQLYLAINETRYTLQALTLHRVLSYSLELAQQCQERYQDQKSLSDTDRKVTEKMDYARKKIESELSQTKVGVRPEALLEAFDAYKTIFIAQYAANRSNDLGLSLVGIFSGIRGFFGANKKLNPVKINDTNVNVETKKINNKATSENDGDDGASKSANFFSSLYKNKGGTISGWKIGGWLLGAGVIGAVAATPGWMKLSDRVSAAERGACGIGTIDQEVERIREFFYVSEKIEQSAAELTPDDSEILELKGEP